MPETVCESVLALPAVCNALPADHDQDDPESVQLERSLAKLPLVSSSLPSVAVELIPFRLWVPPVASCVTVPVLLTVVA